jgi:diacylglycerol kinase
VKETRKWLRSFRYAYEGLIYALSTQRNMKFHFSISFLVLILALFFDLSKMEILFIMLAITLIIVAELLNTAIEKAVDLAMPDQHPVAKIAKDVAAAAVLVTAVFAVAVGMIVFYEPFGQLLHNVRTHANPTSVGTIWIFTALVLLSMVVIHTRFSKKRNVLRPSLISALSFSISTLMILYVPTLIVGLLACSLSFLVLIILYEKTNRSFNALWIGGLIGSLITFLVFYLLQSI